MPISDMVELTGAVERLMGCPCQFVQEDQVLEMFGDETVWDGPIATFSLEGHPEAEECFAWSLLDPPSGRRRYYSVASVPPVNSPSDAVRAVIVKEYRDSAAN